MTNLYIRKSSLSENTSVYLVDVDGYSGREDPNKPDIKEVGGYEDGTHVRLNINSSIFAAWRIHAETIDTDFKLAVR